MNLLRTPRPTVWAVTVLQGLLTLVPGAGYGGCCFVGWETDGQLHITPTDWKVNGVGGGGGVLQENLELSEESALRSPETLQWGRG